MFWDEGGNMATNLHVFKHKGLFHLVSALGVLTASHLTQGVHIKPQVCRAELKISGFWHIWLRMMLVTHKQLNVHHRLFSHLYINMGLFDAYVRDKGSGLRHTDLTLFVIKSNTLAFMLISSSWKYWTTGLNHCLAHLLIPSLSWALTP